MTPAAVHRHIRQPTDMLFRRRWTYLTAVCLIVSVAVAGTAMAETALRYPGRIWEPVPLSRSGWSGEQLDVARAYAREIGSTAVVIVQHGAMVASWGDTDANLLLNSVRKSLLDALIGIAVANRQIDLDATLGQLDIDDNPPSLTAAEKQATVRDLLQARSGVYHPANYETPAMAARRPARGSHPPGTFWYYNNWDFNALGAIYRRATGTQVFAAFARQIAAPIGMQDFNPAACRYDGGPNSIYPAYLFFASARDLARFGLLFLRHGRWGNRQIVPAAWVQASTTPSSRLHRDIGYGYLWWMQLPDEAGAALPLPAGSYWAEGHGGQFIFVIPAYDMVVVHLVRTRFAGGGPIGVPLSQVFRLLSMIFAAMPPQ